MATAASVLRVNCAEETTAYRNAVAEIIGFVMRENSRPGQAHTLIDISERIGVSLGTISNAANKKADLSPTFLNRLGKCYGTHVLNPFAKLSGGQMVPLHPPGHRDILPFLNRAALKVAEARDEEGPGGVREIHSERFGYLPALHDVVREANALICEIEAERDRMTGTGK